MPLSWTAEELGLPALLACKVIKPLLTAPPAFVPVALTTMPLDIALPPFKDRRFPLVSALSFFMMLRTHSQLRALKTGAHETEAIVRIAELSTRDRDLLRDALRIVKQFREVIRNRYQLSLFS